MVQAKTKVSLGSGTVPAQPSGAELVLSLEMSMLERKVRIGEWETSSGRPREQMYPNQMAVRL